MRFAFIILVSLSLGCVGRGRNAERYVPKPEDARQALAAALDAWQAGALPGSLADRSPAVNVVDSHRRAGQKLVSYEILGEVPGEGGRCLAVRLGLDNPREDVKARFVVFGIDPLWVYRYEDFEMLVHWEHPMAEGATAKGAGK